MLGEALATTFAARQLIYTALICAGIHVLMTWGEVTNWGQHYEMDVCVFRWAHPAGFRSIPVAMVWVIPTDAFLVAFFVCLGQTKRAVDVRRGVLPHVPPDAAPRRPRAPLPARPPVPQRPHLAPRRRDRLGRAVGRRRPRPPRHPVGAPRQPGGGVRPAARRAVGRRRDVPHGLGLHCAAHHLVHGGGRARVRGLVPAVEHQRRGCAAADGARARRHRRRDRPRRAHQPRRRLRSAAARLLRRVYHLCAAASPRPPALPCPPAPSLPPAPRPAPPPPCAAAVPRPSAAAPGLLLALLAALLGHGAVPTELWVCAGSATTAATTLRMGDESVPPPRRARGEVDAPRAALRRLPTSGSSPSAPSSSAAPRSEPARRPVCCKMLVKNAALPFSDPLQIANATADNLHHLAIGLFALATFLWLYLSVRTAPLACGRAHPHAARLVWGHPHALRPVARLRLCLRPHRLLRPPLGCTGVKAQALSSLMPASTPSPASRSAPPPRASACCTDLRRPRLPPPTPPSWVCAGWGGRGERRRKRSLGDDPGPAAEVLGVGLLGRPAPLFAAAAGGAFTTFVCLSGGRCLLALLLVFMAHWEWRRYGSRVSQLTYAGRSFPTAARLAAGRPTAPAPRRRRRRRGSRRRRRLRPRQRRRVGRSRRRLGPRVGGRGGVRRRGPGQIWGTPARPGGNHLRHVPHDERRSTTPRAAPRSSRTRTTTRCSVTPRPSPTRRGPNLRHGAAALAPRRSSSRCCPSPARTLGRPYSSTRRRARRRASVGRRRRPAAAARPVQQRRADGLRGGGGAVRAQRVPPRPHGGRAQQRDLRQPGEWHRRLRAHRRAHRARRSRSPAVITNTLRAADEPERDGVAGGVGSCCAGDPNDSPPCGAGTTPQLNISVAPPASCDEHCGWFWLWFPCRCHAAAMLTVTVPHLLDYKGAGKSYELEAFRPNYVPSLECTRAAARPS